MRTAIALLGVLVLAGCDADGPPADPPPAPIAWQEVTLPPPGGGRVVVRDAAACDDHWYVVGGTVDADGTTHPAAWRSGDGRGWQPMSFTALPASLYGPRNIIYSVACRGGQVAMIGASRGGAHDNPRTSTWRGPGAGATMTEVAAPFELYGGPDALDVARLAAGPSGFAIAGNRTTGAAVWLSADATRFRLVTAAPADPGTAALAAGAGATATAADVAVSGAGVTLVGSVRRAGRVDDDPAGWRSVHGGAWVRTELPGGTGDESLQRVVHDGDDLVAAGLRGATFGSWRLADAAPAGAPWQAAAAFGRTKPGGLAGVRSLAATGAKLVATVDDGAAYGVWTSADGARSWTAGTPPTTVTSGAEHAMAVAGAAGRMLLVADDGVRGRAWLADPA